MSRNSGAVALAIVWIVFIILWSIFGYATLIAAFLATDGILQVMLGLYTIGCVFVAAGSIAFKRYSSRL